jgi:secondary thiamine-phosphate synthase enzyme
VVRFRSTLELSTPGRGLHEITGEIAGRVVESGLGEGLAHLFLCHTSASLVVQENADPSARHDLERWFDRIAPDGDAAWTHRSEGPDDMPSHVRAALTATELSIPIGGGSLLLGTWQGIFLFEHRRAPHRRRLVLTLLG